MQNDIFFRKTDGFPLKLVNLQKNIEKRVIYAVLEKKIYCGKIRIKA